MVRDVHSAYRQLERYLGRFEARDGSVYQLEVTPIDKEKTLSKLYESNLSNYALKRSHDRFLETIKLPITKEFKFLILPETIDFNPKGVYGGGETIFLPLNELHKKNYIDFFSSFSNSYYINAEEIKKRSTKPPVLSLDVITDIVYKSLYYGFRETGVKESYMQDPIIIEAIKEFKKPSTMA